MTSCEVLVEEVAVLIESGCRDIRRALDLLQEHYVSLFPKEGHYAALSPEVRRRFVGLGMFKSRERSVIANSHSDLERVERRLLGACERVSSDYRREEGSVSGCVHPDG